MSDLIERQTIIDWLKYKWNCNADSLFYGIQKLPPAQPDNQINLCDSCDYSYPDCPSKNDDVIFGNGIGNDNICACNKYKPHAQPEPTRIISEMRAIPSDDDHVSLSETVMATYYDEENEEWSQKSVTVRDVLDSVCDEYTVLPSAQLDLSEYSDKLWRNAYERGKRDVLERKTGKWVHAEDEFGIDGNHCDQCGFFVPWDYIHTFINYIENYHYCPNCGVKMMKKGDNNG